MNWSKTAYTLATTLVLLTSCATEDNRKKHMRSAHNYGQEAGCLAARQNYGSPEQDWKSAPPLNGTYVEFVNGWKTGFQGCRNGLGPAKTP